MLVLQLHQHKTIHYQTNTIKHRLAWKSFWSYAVYIVSFQQSYTKFKNNIKHAST